MYRGIPVIDSVVHPYNLDKSNLRAKNAPKMAAVFAGIIDRMSSPGYRLGTDEFCQDWSMEETSNMSFLESYTDLAAYHVLPLNSYADGLCSIEKGLEAKKRWPERFVFYAGIDPMLPNAIDLLEEQVERLEGPVGLKLYPNSYVGDEINSWLMDDPEVAYPVFARTQELGIRVVAVHKALPLGGMPMRAFRVDDIDDAARDFPELNFEIVHGGMGFCEETASQLERFPNVWVNLETTSLLLTYRPAMFEDSLARLTGLLGIGGLRKMFWGTGAVACHPRPLIEKFVDEFQFRPERVEEWNIPQITQQDKEDILANNYARMLGLDLDARLDAIADDHFARAKRARGGELAKPFSLTHAAGRAH